MSSVSNHYIDSILRPTCPNFHGVFSSDNIPKKLVNCKQFSIICNLSVVGEKGSHFVTIISLPQHVLYIDSLGQPCTVLPLKNFLRRLDKPTYYNAQQIQDALSSYCGFFCILFVLKFNHFSSPTICFEKKNLPLNDDICIMEIKKILNKIIFY